MDASPEIPTVVSLSPLPKGFLEQLLLPHLAGRTLDLVSAADSSPEGLQAAVQRARILLGDYTFERRITAATIQEAGRLQLIQQPSVGVQHIDLEACRAKGIPVANAAGANDKSVAEHTILLALMLLKKALYFHRRTEAGVWAQSEAFELGVFELAGKRWGIVGMGRIGRELARRLGPFGTEIVYFDPRRLPAEEEDALGVAYVPLEKLIRRSDIVSLHVPLTPETRGMIGAEVLRSMKTGSYLINVARGELVDEKALAEALNTGAIAGAGIDVFSEEPIRPGHPLLTCRNVVLTPHLAGTTNEARARVIEVSVKNILRVLNGEKPVNVVNGV
ncbi:MAG TPA: 2-hydroxyacid dehydrogenase [bacterium]|nr:2-hydroxyacid dehydrogenase [bacterium]